MTTEPTLATIMRTLKGTHRTGHKAVLWLRTRNVNLGCVPETLCGTGEGRARVLAEASARSFRGGDEFGSHPVGDVLPGSFGGCGDGVTFGSGGAELDCLGAGVVYARSSGSGHTVENSGHGKSLTMATLAVHNKSMTNTSQSDGYVECGECGHAIEAHDANGCVSIGGECPCVESWTEREIRRVRVREGLPASYNAWDIS